MRPLPAVSRGGIERPAIAAALVFAVTVLALPTLFGTAPKLFDDGDTYWHLAVGRWIIEHGAVPTTDPFSFTMAGQPWTAHEWLADIVLAGAFDLAGYAGVAALVTAALTLLQLIIFRRIAGGAAPAIVFLTLLSVILVVAPFFLARPHVLVWPIMALWTSVLLDAADRAEAPPWWLPAVMVAWVNLHGSFILGLVIFGAIAIDAWHSRNIALRRWIVIGFASAAATLVNANGLSALTFPFTVARMETLPLIAEWRPSAIGDTPFFFLVVAAAVAAMLWRRAKLAPGRLLLLLFLCVMALSQMRHQTWLVIAAALIVPRALAARGDAPACPWPPLPVAAVAAAAPALLALLLAPQPRNGPGFPQALIAAIPPPLRAQPLFNEYSFGGPLILAGIRPYIDGRADMYGDAFFADYERIDRGDLARFDQAVGRHGIRWTMLAHGNARLIKALDASPRWRRLFADEVGVIHVRTGRGPR